MPSAKYGASLRALGWYLQQQHGWGTQIEEDGAGFVVRWRGLDGQAHEERFTAPRLDQLQQQSRQVRGTPPGGSQREHAEWLRTIGQELDRQGLTQVQIREGRGYRVDGWMQGLTTITLYGTDELRALSAAQRAARRPADAAPPPSSG